MKFVPQRRHVFTRLDVHFLRELFLGLPKLVEAWRIRYVHLLECPQDRSHMIVRESQVRHVVKDIQQKHLSNQQVSYETFSTRKPPLTVFEGYGQ